MTTHLRFSLFLFLGFLLLVSTVTEAQFITIARKIKTMRTGQADIATVIIDARL